ncbi:FkbM family methyltransferase [Thiohalophilus sp.]|uniref:FkbM family methyltransferase n=1 Tax=Thiohalophilus sp. TaxID=3028392 RepID=UPI003976A64E
MSQTPLYKNLSRKGYYPEKVAEVGVYFPENSNIRNYIDDGIPSLLIEPDPQSLEKINNRYSGYKNVEVYPVAVGDESGKLELVKAGASTYARNLEFTPAIVNDGSINNTSEILEVRCVRFNEIDPTDINLISIDIEGGEWYVIKHMLSRPDVISIETHGGLYFNPFMVEIISWFNQHGYKLWYRDGSDSIYIKNKLFNLSYLDEIKTYLYGIYLRYKSARKTVKRAIRRSLRMT